MKRWKPRTLSGWFAIIMLFALMVSQLIALVILIVHGRIMTASAQRRETLERIAVILRLYNDIGIEGLRSNVAIWPTFTLNLRTYPAVDAKSADGATSAALSKLVTSMHPYEVHVVEKKLPWVDGAGFSLFSKLSVTGSHDAESYRLYYQELLRGRHNENGLSWFGPSFIPPTEFTASIKTAEDSWLNIVTVAPPMHLVIWPFFLSLFLGVAAVTAAAVLAARRVAQPLEELGLAVRSLGRVEPLQLAHERGPEDVRRLITTFNDMAKRLRKVFEEQSMLLRSIGHDLRTPITSLRICMEFIEDEELKQKMLATLAQVEHLTNAALDAARGGASGEAVRRVDLSSLVEAACDDVAEVGGQVENQVQQSVFVSVRTGEVRRAVRNLIENAVRHGGGAHVSLEPASDGVSIVVEDSGPGVPMEMLERIIEPFMQMDDARSGPGGHGLGLTIVHAIAQRHNGALRLKNRPQGGLHAELWLPAA